MAMLAEPRRRKRYCLNPRGKALYEDDARFGTKMLEKMGWSKGKGLGAKENGSLDFVRVRFKDDAEGLGYAGSVRDDQWTAHEESFNGLLKSLNGETVDSSNSNESNSNNIDANSDDDMRPMGFGFKMDNHEEPAQKKKQKLKENISGVSLEEKSKSSKARVHYKKFTRGKDLSRYSEKDLANIFGKKATEEQADNIYEQFTAFSNVVATETEAKDVEPNFAGVPTVPTGLSVNDYFKAKMEALKNRKANGNGNTAGDTSVQQLATTNEEETIQAVNAEDNELRKKSKKKRKQLDDVEPASEVVECSTEEPEKPRKKKKKQKDLVHEEAVEELPELVKKFTEEETKSKKKKKSKLKETEVFESNAEATPAPAANDYVADETSQKKKKNKKSKSKAENEKPEEDTTNIPHEIKSDAETIPVKRKKHKKNKVEPTVDATNNEITAQESSAEVANNSKTKRKKNKSESNSSENVSENLQIKEIPNDNSSNEDSDQQPTQTETAELLSMENLLKKRDSFDIFTISSFCAEKFRHFDMKAFKGSELHKIPGYGIDANIKLVIVNQPSDEKRILDLWNNTNTKYSTFRQCKNFGTHLKMLKQTKTLKSKTYHLQTFKRRNAFSVI